MLSFVGYTTSPAHVMSCSVGVALTGWWCCGCSAGVNWFVCTVCICDPAYLTWIWCGSLLGVCCGFVCLQVQQPLLSTCLRIQHKQQQQPRLHVAAAQGSRNPGAGPAVLAVAVRPGVGPATYVLTRYIQASFGTSSASWSRYHAIYNLPCRSGRVHILPGQAMGHKECQPVVPTAGNSRHAAQLHNKSCMQAPACS